MSRTPEGKVKDAIRDWLRGKGVFFFSPNAGPFGTSGIPDIIVCVHGRFLGIEVKAPGKLRTLTQRQKDVGDEIIMAGGTWIAVDNVADMDRVEFLFKDSMHDLDQIPHGFKE